MVNSVRRRDAFSATSFPFVCLNRSRFENQLNPTSLQMPSPSHSLRMSLLQMALQAPSAIPGSSIPCGIPPERVTRLNWSFRYDKDVIVSQIHSSPSAPTQPAPQKDLTNSTSSPPHCPPLLPRYHFPLPPP